MRWRSCCLISRSLPRMRLRIVRRLTANRPSLFFPLMCLKPRKSGKVKRLRLTFPSSFPVLFGKPPEFDPACFIWVEFQAELAQSFPQIHQEAICIRPIKLAAPIIKQNECES